MSAVWNVTGNTGGVDVVQAYRTVRSGNIFDTPMAIEFKLQRQAHVAHLAVEEATSSTDSANPAAITVILIAILIVKEITHQTGVPSESHPTLLTLCLNPLPGIALSANQLCDRFPIEEMRLILVMAVSTHVELIAARSHKFGTSLVVCTSHTFFLRILLWLVLGLFPVGCSHN